MRTTVAVLLCVVLLPACCWAAATETGRTREFPEYRCKLTLPGRGYQWLDHTKISGGVAFFADASGTIRVLMMVQANPDGEVIDEESVKLFDDAFTQAGGVSKLSGRIGRFRGVPCYQLHARFEGSNSPATVRVFAANGYIFQLQLHGSNLPLSERGKLEPVFSAFEFIGEPELPVPKAAQEEELEQSTAKYKYIAYISVGALAVIILVIRYAARRRKKRRSSG